MAAPTLDLTINEIIAKYPEAITVLNTFGFDTCCGGGLTLRDAAHAHRIDEQQVLAALDEVVSP